MIDVTLIVGLVVYLLPTLVALARKHPQTIAILISNVLLGWTFLGWIGVLVWAFNAKGFGLRIPTAPTTPLRQPKPPTDPSPRPRSTNAYAAQRACPHCSASIPLMAVTCPRCGGEAYASTAT